MTRHLSIRESQILRLVAAGMTTKAIAATLSIAQSTVNWHIGNALAKLGASSRAEAVAIMLREGAPPEPIVVLRPSPAGGARRLVTVAAAMAVLIAFALAGATALAALRTVDGGHRDGPAIDSAPLVTASTTSGPGEQGAPATDAQATPAAPPHDAGAPATPSPVVGSAAPSLPTTAPAPVSAPVIGVPALATPSAPVPSLPAVILPPPLTPAPTALPPLPLLP